MKAQILLLALLVSGCSSVSRDLAFNATNQNALALVVADGMPINGSNGYSFHLARVDLATRSFAKDQKYINFSGMGPIEGDEFQRGDLKTTLRFGGAAVPAGDWVVVSRSDSEALGTLRRLNVNCFTLGTSVYRFVPGRVNLVRMGHVGAAPAASDEEQGQLARKVLATYQSVSAQMVEAEVVGMITFGTGKGMLGDRNCFPKGSFEFTPARAN